MVAMIEEREAAQAE